MGESLGNKLTCSNCSTRFYDLGKEQAECPKCGTVCSANNNVISIPENDPGEDHQKHAVQSIDGSGDIDLGDFDQDDNEEQIELKTASIAEPISDIEDVEELEDHLEALSELEDIEIEEDLRNSDDAEDSVAIDDMEILETLIDKVDEDGASEKRSAI